MIELPRACVVADRIAEHADFFSFGTNDLTQTTFGLSRDDAGRFLPAYVEQRLLPNDPFAALDPDGVGALIELGVRGGRRDQAEPQGRHLRRARRRAELRRVLPPRGLRLRVVLAVPGADRAARGGAGGARERQVVMHIMQATIRHARGRSADP